MNAVELIRELSDAIEHHNEIVDVAIVINGETFEVEVQHSVTGEVEIHAQ